MPRGQLHLIAAPAESADLTLRALRILQDVAAVACEDLGAVRKLLTQLAIDTEVIGLVPHVDMETTDAICERLLGGDSIALLADLSLNEGQELLVRQAIRHGIHVIPAPGASPLLAAVQVSALAAENILILGPLPKTDAARREVLGPMRNLPCTLVITESPRRLADTLRGLERSLGDRRAVVARDPETFVRDRLSSLAGVFVDPPQNNVVIVVGPPEANADGDFDARSAARVLLAGGMRPAEVAKTIADRFGLAKRDAYRTAMDANEEPRAPDAQPLEDLLLEKLRAYAESLRGHAPENMYGLIMPQLERPLIRVAMEISGGRQIQAAEMLGIHRNTLRTKLRSLGLDDSNSEPKEEEA